MATSRFRKISRILLGVLFLSASFILLIMFFLLLTSNGELGSIFMVRQSQRILFVNVGVLILGLFWFRYLRSFEVVRLIGLGICSLVSLTILVCYVLKWSILI
jgi:hypothetical protein